MLQQHRVGVAKQHLYHLTNRVHKITTLHHTSHTTVLQSVLSVCYVSVLWLGCNLPLRPLTDLGHPASCLGVSWKCSEWNRRASERGRERGREGQ